MCRKGENRGQHRDQTSLHVVSGRPPFAGTGRIDQALSSRRVFFNTIIWLVAKVTMYVFDVCLGPERGGGDHAGVEIIRILGALSPQNLPGAFRASIK